MSSKKKPKPMYLHRTADGAPPRIARGYDATFKVTPAYRASLPDMMETAEAIPGAAVPIQQVGIAGFRLPLNYRTKEAAQAEALKRCRGYRDAPQSTKDLCKVVETFSKTCLAVAWDPDNGTTGLIIGGAVGALLGRSLDGGRDRTLGTILGAAAGALIGKELDDGVKCR